MRRAVGRLLGRAPGPVVAPEVVPRALLEWRRGGTLPLDRTRAPGDALRVAVVIPTFRRGSGGHQTIVHLALGLRERGHDVSLWLADDEGRHADGLAPQHFADFFGWDGLRDGFADWDGCDVALATGWQTVHRVLRLPGCGARAYLVQDHEPDFYPASASRTWAGQTYGLGLHCIAASRWLAGELRDRYGASAGHFDLALDHSVYRPRETPRDGSVLFYARATTPRRAVPLGLLALEELAGRRDVAIALFGEAGPVRAAFPHRSLGVLGATELADAYARAEVGLVLSMTNISLVPLEMLACGLPCVELATPCLRAELGEDGPVELASFDPVAVADALERLLDDDALRERRRRAGAELVGGRTWSGAAEQVEGGLKAALGAR